MARKTTRERPGNGAAKGKRAAPESERPEGRAAGEMIPEPPPEAPTVRRDLVPVLLMVLAGAATAFIWYGARLADRAEWGLLATPEGWGLGALLTAMIWIIALAGMLARLQARRTVRALKTILAHAETVRARLRPMITEEESGLRMRSAPAWVVAGLGFIAAATLWYTEAVERAVGEPATLAIGGVFSLLLALAIAANGVNRRKAQRLGRDFRAALQSERLALDTLGAIDVMASACLPSGERTRFNDRYLRFVGRDEASLRGRGWLEAVHPDDRNDVLEAVGKPLSDHEQRTGWSGRAVQYSLRNRDGDFVWVRETLVPRMNADGELIEFIATAIDVTAHVQAVAALDKQLGDAKADLGRASGELNELKSEQTKTKASRNRFEQSLTEAREEAAQLRRELDKAEAAVQKLGEESASQIKEARDEARAAVKAAQDQAEQRVSKLEEAASNRVGKLEEALKAARMDVQVSGSETKKLTRACETLREEIGLLKTENSGLREQVARHIAESREATSQAEAAQAGEAQNLAKRERLAQRVEELEKQLAAREAALNAAQGQAAQASAAAQTAVRVTEHCAELEAQLAAKDAELAEARAAAAKAAAAASAEAEQRARAQSGAALAAQVRARVQGVLKMTAELAAQGLDGPARAAAENAAAGIRAIAELVEPGAKGAERAGAPIATVSSFDPRRAIEGVRDLLADEAKGRGVALRAEAAANVPGLVHADDTKLRAAVLSLTDAALRLTSDGTMTIRLSEDVSTAAHTTLRCTISHGSARVKTDALEAAMAMGSTDDSMPDAVKQPVEHQAAKAWRTVRQMQGQHGFVLPEEGGFSIWFTFTLARPAATMPAPARAAPPAAVKAEPAAAPAQPEPPDAEASSKPLPRMPQEQLNCNLGEVVELGADSARVMCAKPPKGTEVTIAFEGASKGEELRGEVMWSKKTDGRRFDVGLRFPGLLPADQKRLLRIAMQHRRVASSMSPE